MTFLVTPGVSNECHLCHMGSFSTCRHVLVFKNVWILDYSGFQKLLISAGVFSFLDSSHYRAQGDPKISILLPQPPKYWDYRRRSEWRWWNGYWLVFEGCGISSAVSKLCSSRGPCLLSPPFGQLRTVSSRRSELSSGPLRGCTYMDTYVYWDKHICALRFTHTSK